MVRTVKSMLDLIMQCVGSLHLDLFVEQHVGSLCVYISPLSSTVYPKKKTAANDMSGLYLYEV